jgi:EpsI family protein
MITVVLLLQLGLNAKFSRTEKVPVGEQLAKFPNQLESWVKVQDGVVDAETQKVLQADDLLTRYYNDSQTKWGANLFIASFRSQRTGVAPHSPKNCLPGNGWSPIVDDRIKIEVPQRNEPIEVNRYIIQRGDSRSLVLYWFQTKDRALASEYSAKFFTMRDAIVENRTDTALVRVIIPLERDADSEAARKAAESFVRAFYGPLLRFLPA